MEGLLIIGKEEIGIEDVWKLPVTSVDGLH
jgi:hypothetical protein